MERTLTRIEQWYNDLSEHRKQDLRVSCYVVLIAASFFTIFFLVGAVQWLLK